MPNECVNGKTIDGLRILRSSLVADRDCFYHHVCDMADEELRLPVPDPVRCPQKCDIR